MLWHRRAALIPCGDGPRSTRGQHLQHRNHHPAVRLQPARMHTPNTLSFRLQHTAFSKPRCSVSAWLSISQVVVKISFVGLQSLRKARVISEFEPLCLAGVGRPGRQRLMCVQPNRAAVSPRAPGVRSAVAGGERPRERRALASRLARRSIPPNASTGAPGPFSPCLRPRALARPAPPPDPWHIVGTRAAKAPDAPVEICGRSNFWGWTHGDHRGHRGLAAREGVPAHYVMGHGWRSLGQSLALPVRLPLPWSGPPTARADGRLGDSHYRATQGKTPPQSIRGAGGSHRLRRRHCRTG